MAFKTGAEVTSSITSVTEEESSFSESDTTETCNSNFSSLMNSTDYNTDDKLTPSLNNISISNSARPKIKTSLHGEDNVKIEHGYAKGGGKKSHLAKHCFAHPIAVKPSPHSQHGKKAQNQRHSQRESLHGQNKNFNNSMDRNSSSSRGKRQVQSDQNPFTFDSPDYNLYTDFTDGSNYFYQPGAQCDDRCDNEEESSDELTEGTSDADRPLYPDMNSPEWHTARIFDRFWCHHNFAMDWYREHIKFFQSQHYQWFSNPAFPKASPQASRKKSRSKDRKRKRARKRRAAKAQQRQKSECDKNENFDENDEEEEEEIIEMEITEDMMEFFSQSFKHRLERDKKKEEEKQRENTTFRIDIEQAMSGQQGPCAAAPEERPGVRRTTEMKLLYGKGAAMIHGMETALQMTFDRFTDKHQPKMWPNMPLKINFA